MKPRTILMLAVALGPLAAPLAGEAQEPGRVWRVGVVSLAGTGAVPLDRWILPGAG